MKGYRKLEAEQNRCHTRDGKTFCAFVDDGIACKASPPCDDPPIIYVKLPPKPRIARGEVLATGWYALINEDGYVVSVSHSKAWVPRNNGTIKRVNITEAK